MRSILFAAALLAAPTPALAVTGAELLQANEGFGNGYVWGVTESLTAIWNDDVRELANHRFNCISESDIKSGTMYDAVVTFIKQNPRNLTEPATFSVAQVMFEICGAPEGGAR